MQLICVSFTLGIESTVLDDYLAEPEAVFKWNEVPELSFQTLSGNTAHILNVTSLEYLDTSKVYSPKGSVWDHEVIILVPKEIQHKNISTVYLSGQCKNIDQSWKSKVDEDLIVADQIAKSTSAVTVVIKQLPNCDLIFTSDPTQ